MNEQENSPRSGEGWKVVLKDKNGGYRSLSDDKPVRYRLGETSVRPRECGPLAVFMEKTDAVEFVMEHPLIEQLRIAPVKVNGLHRPDDRKGRYALYTYGDGKKSWYRRGVEASELPRGTMVAECVTITARAMTLHEARTA